MGGSPAAPKSEPQPVGAATPARFARATGRGSHGALPGYE